MKNYKTTINEMLIKIENELDFITVSDVIKSANYSKYHFGRIFEEFVGESIAVHIKRLKMQKAARQIQTTQKNITQIAMYAGYQTHSAFCVAFKEMFGCSPTEFKTYKINFVKDYKMLVPEIVSIEPIEVLTVRHVGAYNECGEAWEKLMGFAYKERIQKKKNLVGKNSRRFGIGYDNPHIVETSKLRYDACITKDDEVELPEFISIKTINGGKYARFLHAGAYEKLFEVYQNIFCGYVVENNIELRDEPIFEEYLNKDSRRTKPENLKTLIYIPIV